MTTFATLLAILMAMPTPQSETAEETSGAAESSGRASASDDKLAKAEQAGELGREGWKLWREGDLVAAAERFEQAVKLDPADESLWNGWGWSLMNQQQYDQAYERFRNCLELNSNHGGALNGAGQAQLFLRNYDQAESYFKRASEDAPAALFGLARVQLLQGEYEKAKKSLNKLAKAGTGELDKTLLKRMFDAAQNKTIPADLRQQVEPPKVVRRETTGSGGNANELNARGWQLFNTGKARAAEIAFRESLDIDPNHLGAKNGLGFTLLNQGKHQAALPIFEQLVATNQQHPGFVNGLARCYAMAGDADRAVTTWQTVDTDNGPVTACTWGIARTLTDSGKLDEALPYWKRIQKETPNDPTVQQMIAKCERDA